MAASVVEDALKKFDKRFYRHSIGEKVASAFLDNLKKYVNKYMGENLSIKNAGSITTKRRILCM